MGEEKDPKESGDKHSIEDDKKTGKTSETLDPTKFENPYDE